MSKQIYAGAFETHPTYGKIMGPVIPFRCWDAEVWPEDADERFDRGEDVDMIPNPHYLPNAGMSLANENADTLLEALGLGAQTTLFPIDLVQRAALRLANADADAHARAPQASVGTLGARFFDAGASGQAIAAYVARLQALIVEGRKRGATHICVG